MEFWHIWIWEMHMGEPQALSHNLYRCCSMRTNCSSAKDFEPNLERWLNIIFFVEQSSPSVSSWRSAKKILHKIPIVAAAVPFQIQPRNPEPWHVEHNQGLTRNSTSRLQRNDITNKLFKIVYFQRARKKKWSYGWSDSRTHTAYRQKIKRWKGTT